MTKQISNLVRQTVYKRTYGLQDLKTNSTSQTTYLVGKRIAGEQGTSDGDWSDFGDIYDTLRLDQSVTHSGKDSRNSPDPPVTSSQLHTVALDISTRLCSFAI